MGLASHKHGETEDARLFVCARARGRLVLFFSWCLSFLIVLSLCLRACCQLRADDDGVPQCLVRGG